MLTKCNDAEKFAKTLGNTVPVSDESSLNINFTSQTLRVKNFESNVKSHRMLVVYTKGFWNLGGDEHYRNFDKIGFSYLDQTYDLVKTDKILDPEIRAYAEIDISILFRPEAFASKSCQLKRFGDCGLVLTLLSGDGTEPAEFWATAGRIEFDHYADSSGYQIISGKLRAEGLNLRINGKLNLAIPRK